MTTVEIVGWSVLILGWIAPRLISDDKQTRAFIGGALSALALGIFVGSFLEKYC